jgi:hypothetical protein
VMTAPQRGHEVTASAMAVPQDGQTAEIDARIVRASLDLTVLSGIREGGEALVSGFRPA